ncbi:hypothetical protein HZ326_1001 [Fusarium oxysporum f. sp. albedinis]|nr:hypothetical protein HZ326_1001 [Fusarium oxysporum f. sp. albedinis]
MSLPFSLRIYSCHLFYCGSPLWSLHIPLFCSSSSPSNTLRIPLCVNNGGCVTPCIRPTPSRGGKTYDLYPKP